MEALLPEPVLALRDHYYAGVTAAELGYGHNTRNENSVTEALGQALFTPWVGLIEIDGHAYRWRAFHEVLSRQGPNRTMDHCSWVPTSTISATSGYAASSNGDMDYNETKGEADGLTVTLTFQVAGREYQYSHNIHLPLAPAEDGILNIARQTFGELEKEIQFSQFHEELPDPTVLLGHPLPTPQEWKTEERAFFSNTREVWFEIVNTLLSAKYLLAQSRAYKEVEHCLIDQGIDHRSQDIFNIHLSKMTAFDGAAYRLAKIEDLFLLLLFVNLGNSLVDMNMHRPGWEKKLVWTAVRDGLRRRRTEAVSNRYLDALSDADYSSIMTVFTKFKNAGEAGEIVAYRDATTHRIAPSVDYGGLNAKLIFPTLPASDGAQDAMTFVRKFSIDHEFLDLYSKAVKVFSHYVTILSELKAVRRFA